jgi:DNA-binding NarL/FixJ family response regulator
MPRKILIVEDEPAIAQDIAFNLEDNGFIVSAVVHSSEKALDYLFKNEVDLILLDINIKGTKNGIEVARIINEKYVLPFIFLTSFSDEDTISEAAKTIPYGYLTKPFKNSDLKPAIITALTRFESEKNKIPALEQLNKSASSPLTKTEYNIIRHIFEGKTNQQIAEANFISVNTVKSHLNSIFLKLNIHSKTQLMSLFR